MSVYEDWESMQTERPSMSLDINSLFVPGNTWEKNSLMEKYPTFRDKTYTGPGIDPVVKSTETSSWLGDLFGSDDDKNATPGMSGFDKGRLGLAAIDTGMNIAGFGDRQKIMNKQYDMMNQQYNFNKDKIADYKTNQQAKYDAGFGGRDYGITRTKPE